VLQPATSSAFNPIGGLAAKDRLVRKILFQKLFVPKARLVASIARAKIAQIYDGLVVIS
jgi:hypothetical protein